jgi:hypothetical protein
MACCRFSSGKQLALLTNPDTCLNPAGIQRMGITCLGLPRERLRRDAATWQRRALAMADALRQHAGWDIRVPRSCM